MKSRSIWPPGGQTLGAEKFSPRAETDPLQPANTLAHSRPRPRPSGDPGPRWQPGPGTRPRSQSARGQDGRSADGDRETVAAIAADDPAGGGGPRRGKRTPRTATP